MNDLVNDVYVDPHRIKQVSNLLFANIASYICLSSLQNFYSTPSRPANGNNKQAAVPPPPLQFQTLYIIVFGYPTTRFSLTAAHFQTIAEGGTTEVEICSDVENAFKLGYKLPWEAARAFRKNGEIVSGEGGRWVVGVKWLVRGNFHSLHYFWCLLFRHWLERIPCSRSKSWVLLQRVM